MWRFGLSKTYEITAFVTGFVLMAYELVAMRILAPAIGSSIYVWTGVIGVIIAALSLGFAVGGRLADKRTEPLDIVKLLLVSALAIVITLGISNSVLTAVTGLVNDPRLQGLLASTVLFMPTSFLLGMISPYLARLKTVSVSTTGVTIASLSALNAVGGIFGTFVTGFIFMAYIGSKETLILIAAALIICSWMTQPRKLWETRLLATVIICFMALLSLLLVSQQAKVIATIDTPTANYRVANFTYQGYQIRGLLTGPSSVQSGIYFNGSKDLVLDYTRTMAKLIELSPRRDSILILGGGAFTLPQYLAEKYPNAKIDVVEIDDQLVNISRQYFDYKDPLNVTAISQDARAFLNTNPKKYDIVLVDAYSELQVPFALSTEEYVGSLKNAVAEDGLVVANIIGANNSSCTQMLGSLHRSYLSKFPHHKAYSSNDSDLTVMQNVTVAYSDQELLWAPESKVNIDSSSAQQLTDNFSPVEYLRQRCVSSA